jgi:hypothetical protein
MQRKRFSILTRALLAALFLLTLLPASAFAQRRWVVVRPSRSRVVIYQPRQRVIYQQRPYYSYPQSYYTNSYSSYGYSQPYYTNQYYSYQYSQPYFANRYSYSWANPTYRYGYTETYRRHRRNGARLRVTLR